MYVYQVSIHKYIRTQIGGRPQLFCKMEMNFLRQMEDNLNFLSNGRRPQCFRENGRQTQLFSQVEDNINHLAKWKMTLIF